RHPASSVRSFQGSASRDFAGAGPARSTHTKHVIVLASDSAIRDQGNDDEQSKVGATESAYIVYYHHPFRLPCTCLHCHYRARRRRLFHRTRYRIEPRLGHSYLSSAVPTERSATGGNAGPDQQR